MSYRIAAASSDGKVINQHFGRAEQFYIIEVGEDGSYQAVETRKLQAACDGGIHNEVIMKRNAEALSDCRYVLVSRIGPAAENLLFQRGITAYEVPDIIENAVKKLVSYCQNNKTKKF